MATIIFDFDGTIADSFDYVSDFLTAQAKLPPLTMEQKNRLRGLSMSGMATQLGYHWWQKPYLFIKGRQRMRQAIKDLKAFHGIPQIIRKLHAEGHELFVLSNNSKRNIRYFLNQQGINQYFLQIYGNVGFFGKAAALKQLFREQHLDKSQAAYIGDEIRDVEAAHSIGLRAVAVSWGFASRKNLQRLKPAALADTPDELMAILEEL